jgi:hypothetical protein
MTSTPRRERREERRVRPAGRRVRPAGRAADQPEKRLARAARAVAPREPRAAGSPTVETREAKLDNAPDLVQNGDNRTAAVLTD